MTKTYSYKELALLYFPDSSPRSASNAFRRWIRKEPLASKLTAIGYERYQKVFTPLQARAIIDHLGEP
jgi:hypothetical protein